MNKADNCKRYYILNRNSIELVLGGNVGYLFTSFTWRQSPQGETYWLRIADGVKVLEEEDRKFLEWLLDDTEDLGEME